jgi:hypothetical protein
MSEQIIAVIVLLALWNIGAIILIKRLNRNNLSRKEEKE